MKGMSRLLHLFPHGPGNAEPGEPLMPHIHNLCSSVGDLG